MKLHHFVLVGVNDAGLHMQLKCENEHETKCI